MKFTVFIASILAFAAPIAHAQDASNVNGYSALVEAGKLIIPDARDEMRDLVPPAENLARQRASVERNAIALVLAREALAQPITIPAPESPQNISAESLIDFQKLARQFLAESDVRLANSDAAGALDSRLTMLQLGRAIAHDAPYTHTLVGLSIEGMARKNIEFVAARLDAPQIRAALIRLDSINAQSTNLVAVLRVEKPSTLRAVGAALSAITPQDLNKSKAILATPEGRREAGLSDEEAKLSVELLEMNAELVKAKIGEAFDFYIARADLPYQQSLSNFPKPNPATDVFSDKFKDPLIRFVFERNRVNNDWLRAALELRAIQLETGQYPASYDAGTDPFSFPTASYIYRREADKYLLYSVGPDGKDEGGAEIQTPQTNSQTGVNSVNSVLNTNSLGDIVAPIF